ncbi:hypothetical protein A4X06_0g9952, partial [Tilletia controversa]
MPNAFVVAAHVWTKRVHEITAPAELVARRIPNDILEGEYGFLIQTKPVEEGGNGEAIGLKVLGAYAMARGFMRQGQGQPDETRSARLRYVLKDAPAPMHDNDDLKKRRASDEDQEEELDDDEIERRIAAFDAEDDDDDEDEDDDGYDEDENDEEDDGGRRKKQKWVRNKFLDIEAEV